MGNYSPSTIAMVGDLNLKRGLVCRTQTVNASAVMTAASVTNMFKVTGRIRIVSLDIEAITVFGGQAAVPRFQFVGVTPVVAAFDISAASASLANLAAGKRVTFAGTALTTALVIDGVAGITVKPANYMDIGWDGGSGFISVLGSTALTSGTCVLTLCYLPQSDGAAAEALM
jgi:hypothetical protein